MNVSFVIPGEPQGKGRPRFSMQHGRTITRTPEQTVLYENLVKMEYRQQCRGIMFEAGVPLDMRIVAYYAIPKSVSKKKRLAMLRHQIRPTKKPDSSNVMKAIEDALNTVAYHDDAQIVDSQIRRFYSDQPRVVVKIQSAVCRNEDEYAKE